MLYKVGLDNNSLLQNYRDMLEHIPSIADPQQIIGPIIEFNKLRACEINLISEYLPNVADYMISFKIDNFQDFVEDNDMFNRFEKYDNIKAFFDNGISLQANFLIPIIINQLYL